MLPTTETSACYLFVCLHVLHVRTPRVLQSCSSAAGCSLQVRPSSAASDARIISYQDARRADLAFFVSCCCLDGWLDTRYACSIYMFVSAHKIPNAMERLTPPTIPPGDGTAAADAAADAGGSERSVVVVSEEADALVESLTSYVEGTVSSLLGGPGPGTPSPVEIHQIPTAATAARKARAEAQRAESNAAQQQQQQQPDGGDGAAFFSCDYCTNDNTEQPLHAHAAQYLTFSATTSTSPTTTTSSSTPPPRAVTMEEPYFSDELSSAREMEALKRSVNDMELAGAPGRTADAPSLTSAPEALLAGQQHRRSLSGNLNRSRSLMTGKLSPEKLAEVDAVVATTETHRRGRKGSIVFAAGPAEADLPPARPEPPEHGRWAVAAVGTDLSGDWTIIADGRFRRQYDKYLANLGFGCATWP